jgi:reactive intermediate/imine deaminase
MRSHKASIVVLAVITMAFLQSPSSKQIVKAGPDLGLPFSPAVKAGGLIYVSGTVATDANGRIAAGDISAQTRRTLDNLAAILDAAGSSLANVACAMVYLKNARDFGAMNDVYRSYWPKDPPARTTVAAALALPEALVEISMVAIPNGGERIVIHPADWLRSPNPYSYGIKTGDTLFLSGLVSRNGKDNSVIQGDVATQTKAVLDNGGAILKAAGMSYADVVSSRVFITDTAQFQAMNGAYRTYFPISPPARATVKSALMGPDYQVEIAMIAAKDPQRTAVTTPNPDGTPGSPGTNPLSSAIRAGNRLYLSGILGNTSANGGDVKSQTTETLARIGRTLTAAGFRWQDVVDGLVYLPDIARFAEMNGAYRQVFATDFPARATVAAGLVSPDALVEIMFTAVK